jgi:putative SOS response-associated peptidase YedK
VCGRYASSRNPDELVEEFEIEAVDGDGPGADPSELRPDFNVAPTNAAPVVLERMPRPADGEDEPDPDGPEPDPVRQLRLLRWGLVPSWAKDRAIGNRMINARAESIFEKPAYRRAATSRRCLVPADGWYEWQRSPTETDAKGKPRKQPFFMSAVDGGPIAIAGVYEFWRDPDKHADDPQAWLTSYAVITTDAEPGLDVIHDRMPLVLPRERWKDWLDPRLQDRDAVRALLERPDPGRFTALAISTRVNNVRNNGPELLQAAPPEQLKGVVDPATGELIGAGDAPLF